MSGSDSYTPPAQPSVFFTSCPSGSRGGCGPSQLSLGRRRGATWTGHQSITGPHRDKRDDQPPALVFSPTVNLESQINLVTVQTTTASRCHSRTSIHPFSIPALSWSGSGVKSFTTNSTFDFLLYRSTMHHTHFQNWFYCLSFHIFTTKSNLRIFWLISPIKQKLHLQ